MPPVSIPGIAPVRPHRESGDREMSPRSELLLRLIGYANPVFFLEEAAGCREEARVEVLRFLLKDTLRASRGAVEAAWQAAGGGSRLHKHGISLPTHVFPVWDESTDMGFVIPFEISGAKRWEVSDAFGRFGSRRRSPLESYLWLLALIERTWYAQNGSVLPARWARPLRARLLSLIHMDVIKETSMQVPLALALVRSLASPDGTGPHALLGSGPVFATGCLDGQGRFQKVERLVQKLQAFVRELGAGHPAVLTRQQYAELRQTRPGLLTNVEPLEVNSLAELLALDPIRTGLEALSSAHHPSYNDQLLTLSHAATAVLEFDQVHGMARWIKRHVSSSYYEFKFSCELALHHFHQGRFQEAAPFMDTARVLLDQQPELFGIDDHAWLFAVVGDMAIDACDPGLLAPLWSTLEARQAEMSGVRRVQVLGTMCQVGRASGDFASAIASGERAVALADHVFASSAGRSRNYLVHARIAAVRAGHDDTRQLLGRAERELEESRGSWAPHFDETALRSHLGFCAPLAAEIDRLGGKLHRPSGPRRRRGIWSHPELFLLLSLARNPAHPRQARLRYADLLAARSAGRLRRFGGSSLFGLFDAVYRLYGAALREEELSVPRRALEAWLGARAAEGYPGWQHRLAPWISRHRLDLEEVERLCDAIPYH
jgi:hypothetical protein